MATSPKTLKNIGYHMPAEWEPHAATWLTWPHAESEAHWPGKLDITPSVWARMVKELEVGEDVHILIHNEKTKRIAQSAMDSVGVKGKRVHLHDAPSNFSWTRDHGPIFVRDTAGDTVLTHWEFNGCGKKWDFNRDRLVPKAVQKITGFDRIEVPMVLEGGSIDVNGKGTLLTTEGCLLHKNRNPKFSKKQIEGYLKQYLGVSHILWLGKGIAGDDTDGHVDDLTRFIGPRTVVTMIEGDPKDVNYEPLQENLRRLQSMTDQDGCLLEIITIPLPYPVMWDGVRLPGSYANFYVANSVVLLPVFSDPHDAEAIAVLQKAFPTRRIAAIDSSDLVHGWGSFHCVTQQQPKE
jgi:agmatine deiminase